MAEQLQRARSLGLGAAIILLAGLLQFHQLGLDQRFLPDEAHFMTFARGAAVNGDWLLPGPLDKPPLSIYVSALSMTAIGIRADAAGVLHLGPLAGEFAGMLPNALLALLLTALMMRLARSAFRDAGAGWLAGLLMAASPYALAYGASAFTDMSLLFFSVLALCMALERRWTWAGLALGMAFWCKQQAVFSAALVFALVWARGATRRDWLGVALPLSLGIGALLIWDLARHETSIFLQAAANNVPAQWLAEPSTWYQRSLDWLGMSLWMLGPPPVTALLLLLAGWSFVRWRGQGERHQRVFVLALGAYAAVHVLFNFNLYDRYGLLALPPLILLVAGALACWRNSLKRPDPVFFLSTLIFLGGIGTLYANSQIGGDRAAYAGMDRLANHINSKPVATVIYDPWLGWQLGYYLGPWHDKRRAHYPTSEALVTGALDLDEAGDRYLAAPLDAPYESWLEGLLAAGFVISREYAHDNFVVYRLRPS